ncbi:BREX system Lon protease-like protein BrxL [Atopobiaceae bacterium HCP3S3_D6]
MDDLSRKLNDIFDGYVVRKDLAKQVRGNAAVPSYVLEYLLGQNCATDDEEDIAAGIERVKAILAQHYVQRSESGLVRSRIKETGYQRVIDKVHADLNEKRDAYEASFENLGIKNVLIDSATIKKNQRLLVSGVWCIADLSYMANEAKDESPYILSSLKPIQLAWFDYDEYCEGRSKFTAEEWLDVIVRTVGLEPDLLSRRSKLFLMTRLVAYCERNYNLIELGPKGTGKSHVFSEFSPHGILISGGEVTPAKLFVNNASGKIGLVGYWDVVGFDEFAGKQKRPNKDIVDIMKNYMANKSFSRGVEQITAEASMAFLGNTSHEVGYLLKNSDLFDDLPTLYHDSAFLDRFHAYIPGWEIETVRGEMFCESYGFIVDYLAEALRYLRTLDYGNGFSKWFELSRSISTRDRDGITKTFSGLVKILFPDGKPEKEQARDLLEFALELRCRVKDQLYRIDGTFERVDMSYRDLETGESRRVTTLEETEYAAFYHSRDKVPLGDDEETMHEAVSTEAAPLAPTPVEDDDHPAAQTPASAAADAEGGPKPGHVSFRENQRGISYDRLFGPYFEGATSIEVIDPYVRNFYQVRNVMELMETILHHRDYSVETVRVHLTTGEDEYGATSKQVQYLQRVADAVEPLGIDFTWDMDPNIHARHIVTDTGWDIMPDRGLDIWQHFDANDAFAVENGLPEMRRVRQFEVTYLRVGGDRRNG